MFHFKYFDTIRHLLRKGTFDDPYVLKIEEVTVINGRVGLEEVPDITEKVIIDSFVEIPKEKYQEDIPLKENEFYVNYSNGEITFNSDQNNKTFVVKYKGRGVVQFPAERIYVHSPNPWAIDNLQELIDFIFQKEQELKDKFTEFSQLVLNKTQEIIQKTNDFKQFLLNKTNEYEHYIDNWIDKANVKINEINTKIKEAINVINIGKKTTENCKKVTDDCIETTVNSRVIWKPSISSFVYINEKYPFPKIGWTIICDDNGDIVRFDGSAWIVIGNILGAIPLVTIYKEGLMSKEDKFKLNSIKQNAEPNLKGKELKKEIPIELKTKSIIFTIPNEIKAGDIGFMLQAPYEGEIIRITAYAQKPSIAGQWGEFSILKCPLDKLNSYDGWQEITDKYNRVKFLGNSRLGEPPQLLSNTVNRYDLFRIICTRQAEALSNITIQIDYRI